MGTLRFARQGLLCLLFAWMAGSVTPADADDYSAYTDRLIVKFRSTQARDAVTAAHTRSGMRLRHARTTASGASVLALTQAVSLDAAESLAAELRARDDVTYAEPDYLMQSLAVPNDPYYGAQWNLFEARGGINVPAAWNFTHGAANIVVAVLDTGILPHEDLTNVLPGYDFVAANRSNDGDGRDADATDPGDWVTSAESATAAFSGCTPTNSSWHGTHVAGIIGAAANNNRGISGINWVSPILPVRVLGKCGGYTSDIIDAMYWAAGFEVEGVPINANPARVINLSLGGSATSCPQSYRNVIDTLNAVGVVVVTSAGNSARDVSQTTPANCSGVIAVAATDRDGDKAWYSNYGEGITLAAPGGSQFYYNDPDGIVSTLNDGATVAANDVYRSYQGTSMAAPHVSGVVSLMLSLNPALNPDQVRSLLQSSARGFAVGSICATRCGAGIVDAGAAVVAASSTRGLGVNGLTGGIYSSANDGSTAQASGGGGGCSLARNGIYDVSLLLLAIAACLVRLRKRLAYAHR